MALPRAVQEQADAADALMAQMGQTGAVDPETGEPIVPPTETAQQAVPVTPAAQPEPKQEPAVNWEHKYLTLKGMFDAEVPRLNSSVKELNTMVNTLRGELQEVRSAPPAAATPTPLITDQDRESFGPDLVSLIERGVAQQVQPLKAELAQVKQENVQLKSQVGNVSQSQTLTAQEVFYGKLEAAVPELKTMNVDPGFNAWLQEVDPIYGLPRQIALNNAAERMDVARTAHIFNAYKALVTPAGKTTARTPADELARQVTPRKTNANATPTETPKLIWTEASIAHFYEDLRRGAIPTEDAARYELDLQSAVAEGRVR